VFSTKADILLASSFVCAAATERYIQQHDPRNITFVITGAKPNQEFTGKPIGRGDEDAAYADYLEALLRGSNPDPGPYLQRVYTSPSGIKFADPSHPDFIASDLHLCAQLDRFDFTMLVRRGDGPPVMHGISI
jgi:2-phosphosulfolactate phosphatase